jgi:hypothetical protein
MLKRTFCSVILVLWGVAGVNAQDPPRTPLQSKPFSQREVSPPPRASNYPVGEDNKDYMEYLDHWGPEPIYLVPAKPSSVDLFQLRRLW